jgi:molybdopterin-containing oxidoreductase family membrane subunit
MNKSDSISTTETGGHVSSYPRFLLRLAGIATDGSKLFYAWMIGLTAMALVGANAWAIQVSQGMAVTGMSDHVSWGLYIANFTFGVGLAAGGVMMVIPAYLYHDDEMHDVVILGELLAIAAVVVCIAFVVVDLGRPDRFWHMLPGLGRFNWPVSMLTWDVIVLNGYLLINLHICGYLLYMRHLGRRPEAKWYLPFVFLSIIWAVSIHTVTAFLYSGLGARPFWNSALLAPRFLVTAFVSGPAFIIVTLQIVRRFTNLPIPKTPVRTLVNIMRVTMIINVVMLVSELFVEFYSGGGHTASARYLFTGLHGHNALVPWIWSAIGMGLLALLLLLCPKVSEHPIMLNTACFLAFTGIWIEKGMGLIIPGFIPSALHEMVEYFPTAIEWRVSAGIWALGLMVYTVAVKMAVAVFTGQASKPRH